MTIQNDFASNNMRYFLDKSESVLKTTRSFLLQSIDQAMGTSGVGYVTGDRKT